MCRNVSGGVLRMQYSYGGQNLISWRRSQPLPTDPVWWRLMHAILSYRGNRHTDTNTPPQIGLVTIHCTAKLSAQCNVCEPWSSMFSCTLNALVVFASMNSTYSTLRHWKPYMCWSAVKNLLTHSTYCVHTRSVSFLIWCLNYWLVDVVARHSQRDAIVNTLTWKRRWQWQWLTIAMILLNIVARRLNRYIHRQYTAIETVGTPLLLLLLKMNMIRVVLSR